MDEEAASVAPRNSHAFAEVGHVQPPNTSKGQRQPQGLPAEAPSDADSEEFIEYMQARQARKPPSRAAPTKAAAKPSSRGRGAAGRRR